MLMDIQIPKPGERVAFASEFIPRADRLLDVGCGSGIIGHFIRTRIKEIYGIDRFPKELKAARGMGLKTKKINLDIEKFPFQEDYFDVITCLDVIEHVKDPRFLLKNINNVLRKKGLLIVSTPNIRFTDHLVKLVFNGQFPKTSIDTSEYDGGHIHFFTFRDLEELLVMTGFSVKRKEGIINKPERGWKGRVIEFFMGKKLMKEFRSGGILIVAEKL
jgi:methionine biosynthesis protein MetW